jgi:hypothetical protein
MLHSHTLIDQVSRCVHQWSYCVFRSCPMKDLSMINYMLSFTKGRKVSPCLYSQSTAHVLQAAPFPCFSLYSFSFPHSFMPHSHTLLFHASHHDPVSCQSKVQCSTIGGLVEPTETLWNSNIQSWEVINSHKQVIPGSTGVQTVLKVKVRYMIWKKERKD